MRRARAAAMALRTPPPWVLRSGPGQKPLLGQASGREQPGSPEVLAPGRRPPLVAAFAVRPQSRPAGSVEAGAPSPTLVVPRSVPERRAGPRTVRWADPRTPVASEERFAPRQPAPWQEPKPPPRPCQEACWPERAAMTVQGRTVQARTSAREALSAQEVVSARAARRPRTNSRSRAAWQGAAREAAAATSPDRTVPAKHSATRGQRVVPPRPGAVHSSGRRPVHWRRSPGPPGPGLPAWAAHWRGWDKAHLRREAADAAWRSRRLPDRATS
jgi:hypothetical protein